jgi:hypothetical protein
LYCFLYVFRNNAHNEFVKLHIKMKLLLIVFRTKKVKKQLFFLQLL